MCLTSSWSSCRILGVDRRKLTITPEDLQIEGVIERSPSPEGIDTEQEIGSKEEKRRRSATIVLSSDEEDEDEEVTFVSTKPTKTVVGGVIDLTDD
jgi:hypothetical protein